MSEKLRMNGIKIMFSLLLLVSSLSYIIILAVINGSLGFISAMSITVLGSFAVAKALGEEIVMSYSLIIGLIIGFGLLRGVLRYFEQYSNHYIAFKLLAIIRDKIFKSLRVLAPARLEGKKKGELISMLTSDIETLEVFYAHTISPIFIAIIVSLTSFLFIGFISSFYLAIVALIGYIVIGIILPLLAFRNVEKPGIKYRDEFASFNAYYLDSILGIRDIILHKEDKKREKEVSFRSDKLLKETKIIRSYSAKNKALTELMVAVFIILALIDGIILVHFNILSIGYMIIGIVTIFSSFSPCIAISNLPSNLNQTLASGDRVLSLLKEKPAVTKITDGKDFNYERLEVNNLSFGYTEDKVLKEVNFKADKGEIIGIVGESGSGKSTILKLLLRFYAKDKGTINYNDIDIENINSDNLLDNVTMVFQNIYLFDETIENNLKIAKEDATEEEIVEACKNASIHEFITSLPSGYKTRVKTMGDNFSAGEKQRIGLARAFLKNSEVILLDEPTSNVDCINEGIILKSLVEQKKKKTIILVSHRKSTMSIADRVYLMRDGRLEEIKDGRKG